MSGRVDLLAKIDNGALLGQVLLGVAVLLAKRREQLDVVRRVDVLLLDFGNGHSLLVLQTELGKSSTQVLTGRTITSGRTSLSTTG
jgi:hypothetical protein